MKMIKIYNALDTVLPVLGGGVGASTQISNLTNYFPTWELIISAIIITIIGAVTGYFIKLLLDKIFKK